MFSGRGAGVWLEIAKRSDMFGADHHNSKESTLVTTSVSNVLLTVLDSTLFRGVYTSTDS